MTKIKENIKVLSLEELKNLSKECRDAIISAVSVHGGHLSSNLGVVEATIALFKVFDFNKDKIIFDVGHQSYTYKLLTGRSLERLREEDGVAGFPTIEESSFDCYGTGHSSTSISAAFGFAYARDYKNEQYDVISFIGDASIVNGVSFEGINLLGKSNHKVIIILNDNDMAISKPVGLIADQFENNSSATLFHNLGYKVIGPIDGHNFDELINAYQTAKESLDSVVIHIKTTKGKGYEYAEKDEVGNWHGVPKFNVETGEFLANSVTWSDIYSNILFEEMKNDEQIIALVPATGYGSSMIPIFESYRNRTIDVGIAEEHAVVSATSLSLSGFIPVVSIYSTFLQRTYDQIIHDAARQNADITFLIDRAGIVGKDGETHQGIYDEAFLTTIPNVVISMASTKLMAESLFKHSLSRKGPFFIRFPKETYCDLEDNRVYEFGKWVYEIKQNNKTAIVSFGPIINKVKEFIKDKNVDLINAMYQKPLDLNVVNEILGYDKMIIYNPYATKEGFANSLIAKLIELGYKGEIKTLTVPSEYIKHSSIEETLQKYHIDVESLLDNI